MLACTISWGEPEDKKLQHYFQPLAQDLGHNTYRHAETRIGNVDNQSLTEELVS